MGFLATTETSVLTGFTAVANAFGGGLLATFRPAFIVGLTIWIALISYEVAFGKSEDSFTYIFTKIGKVFLIGVFALYGWPELADLIGGVKDGFVGANTISSILESKLIDPITLLWSRLWDWFTSTLADVGWTEVGRLFSSLALFALLFIAYGLMSLAVAVFGCIALAMFLVANSVFILLMAVGPFFLLCLTFPFMQRFFETFIGNVMTAILGMAFTVLMVYFVSNLFGLTNIQNVVPVATDAATISTTIKSMAVLFCSKAAMTLLIIYLYFKVFDLASALGGGLNMGNNMVGGVRAIISDMNRGRAASSGSAGNSIANGKGVAGGGGGNPSASDRARQANRTFTGMAGSAIGAGISAGGQSAIAGARSMGRLGGQVGAVGRLAYNRYSQNRSRSSAV